jgi:hypothetical protein
MKKLVGFSICLLLVCCLAVPSSALAKKQSDGKTKVETRFVLSPNEKQKVHQGDTFVVKALLYDANNTKQDVTDESNWTVDSSAVATVKNGTFLAVKPGLANITASYNGKKLSLPVNVLPKNKSDADSKLPKQKDDQEKASKSTSPDPSLALVWQLPDGPITLQAGKAIKLEISVSNSDKNQDAQKSMLASLQWSSSDPTVVKVERGTLYGLKPGDAIITAQSSDKSQSINVTVTPADKKQTVILRASETSAVIAIGETKSFTVQAGYTDGNSEDVTGKAQWESSSDTLFTVNQGKIKGLRAGNGVLKITFDGKSAYIQIKVLSTSPSPALSPAPTPAPMQEPKPSQDSTLTPSPVPSGHPEDHPQTVTNPGEPVVLNSIRASESSVAVIVGQSRSVSVYALYSDGTKTDIAKDANFSSLSPSLFSASGGTITGLSAGNGVLKIEYHGFTQYMNVKVNKP